MTKHTIHPSLNDERHAKLVKAAQEEHRTITNMAEHILSTVLDGMEEEENEN